MAQAINLAPVTRLSLGEKLLIAGCVYFVALKAMFTFGAGPIADEAYYWLWGQHPALSYFDHPPLQGWLQGMAHLVFGRSLFALRFFSIVAFAGVLAVFYLVARRVAGDQWRPMLLKSALVYLASPVFGWFGSVVFIDYLLVALMLGAGWFFFCYFADVEARGRGQVAQLFAGAALLGLAGLTKYNAGYLGLAIVATVLIRPRLRRQLLDWPIYAAGALTLAILTPLAIWTLEHGAGSFAFHAAGRFGGSFEGINVGGMKAFAIDTVSLLGPFIVPAFVAFFVLRQPDSFQRVGKTVALVTFALSTATFLYIANFAWVMWWWNSAALVLALPFLGRYLGAVLLPLHVVWGAVIQTALTLSFAIVPVTVLIGQAPFMETDSGYGWDRITEAVRVAQADSGAGFIASNRYQSASQLAFALDDAQVVELSPRRTAFDDWTDDAALTGQSAIVLDDGRDYSGSWMGAFESVEELAPITIARFGYTLATYRLFLARGYDGDNAGVP